MTSDAIGTVPSDPMLRALLIEIAARLRDLSISGASARIDLRRLPLPPDGLTALRVWLGEGEVTATVRGVGACCFRETGSAGVWWVVQENTAGEAVGEFIEIGLVPDLLKAAVVDVMQSANRLEAALARPEAQA